MYNHQLDAFLKVADMGSFGKAAEAMYISSTAIIQQMNLLEDKCGAKLFIRSNHGAKLTPAGQSLYEDAKTIIRLCEDALEKMRQIAESSTTKVRIGTSLLFKCRLLPDIWTSVSSLYPDLKIEIIPLPEHSNRNDFFPKLGVHFDVFEGIYGSNAYREVCDFLELKRTPFCCAVSKNHRLAHMKEVTMDDLNGEYLVMPVEGVSYELDDLRKEILQKYPTVQIIDSPYYGVDTFTLCEVNPYVLITQKVYEDIHTNLITIPFTSDYSMPYGLMYSKTPTMATEKFIEAVKRSRLRKK